MGRRRRRRVFLLHKVRTGFHHHHNDRSIDSAAAASNTHTHTFRRSWSPRRGVGSKKGFFCWGPVCVAFGVPWILRGRFQQYVTIFRILRSATRVQRKINDRRKSYRDSVRHPLTTYKNKKQHAAHLTPYHTIYIYISSPFTFCPITWYNHFHCCVVVSPKNNNVIFRYSDDGTLGSGERGHE